MTLNTHFPLQPVFDGHNDLLLRLWLNEASDPVSTFLNGSPEGHLDLPRSRQGGFAGGLFAVFIPPASYMPKLKPHAAQQPHDPLAITHQQISLLQRIERQSNGQAKICRTAGEIESCIEQGVLAMVLHIEGAEAIDVSLGNLDEFYQAGLRSIGPLWNLPNQFGVGVTGDFPGSPDSGDGLTLAGLGLLRACNRKRILIDVSHMNEKAFWQTARFSDAPLVATHSNAHALCAQPRNLTDKQLAAIAESDGFVGVNFGNAFLRADGKRDADTPIDRIVQHIEYLLEKLGEDRVGLGSDFDGISVPEALGDVKGLPLLLQAMKHAGYSNALIEKLACRNWLKVLKQTWGK
ncbi:dipeptidase [Rouxiella badensis]|jgi:membrane dipeptidase|uniref:Peptidase n=1 Tax=Rouxiella badensis TaxID=1646377 RepID=A0A1X0W9V7_9GAMM|nr:dipeptidase [Rouxiella badensis]MCC3720146.1 dipeptidase [Rouxiella badensis]MCC3729809.1 dipeptidase [Rouxiella badensis]MCC3734007.1 dipeptidase [Rouxiella badensis]MCC3741296.1 dipeptidase [Rouxiella badensis]MCC3748308.1 dipeptidase [Rouxiella badensis]